MTLVRETEVEGQFGNGYSTNGKLSLSFVDAFSQHVVVRRDAEGMLEQRFQPDTAVYVTVEEGLLKLNSQSEYEEANGITRPEAKKGRKKAEKAEDREPELSGAAASTSANGTGEGKE